MRLLLIALSGALLGGGVALFTTRAQEDDRSKITASSRIRAQQNRARSSGLKGLKVVRQVGRDAPKQRDLSSQDSRYDPVQYVAEDEDLELAQIFDQEPRDDVYAPVFEKRNQASIREAFEKLDLVDSAKGVEVECRTLTCRTRVEVSDDDLRRAYRNLNGVMFGDMQSPSMQDLPGDTAYVTFYISYRPITREDRYYERLRDEATRPSIEAARKRMQEQGDASSQ